MNALNLGLFDWLAAGPLPTPWVLLVARSLALWGSWAAALVVCHAVWRQPADRAYLFVVLALAGVASLLSHALATALGWPRPFMLGIAPVYIGHGGRGTLPSTHASVMFFVALALMLRASLWAQGMVLFGLAAATGWARIYVGVHFPLDIAAGFLLATLLAGCLAAVRYFFVVITAASRPTAPVQPPPHRSPHSEP